MENIENNNREYYTFAEILTGLRDDYKINQELLEKLHKYIKIVSKFNTKSELTLSLKNNSSLDFNYPKLSLHVEKMPSSINTLFRYTLNKYTFNEARWMLDNAALELIENDNEFYFKQNYIPKLKDIFIPEVLIKKPIEFASTYNDLKNTKLYTLPSLYIKINPYQTLHVLGHSIHLLNSIDRHKELTIEYIIENDSILIESNIGYSTFFIEQLLKTKIPKYEFPNEYISLLDEKENKNYYLFIYDTISKKHNTIGRKKESLQFKNKDKKLVLTKKQNHISY